MSEVWNLRSRIILSGVEVAYDVLGFGPPLVLVHGTPGNSYIWRNVALRLADRFSVYAYDLPGFGQSGRNEGQDVSIPTQARLLAELVEALNLDAPSIAGHDIGGAITLRAHLLEGVPFACIALIDSVALRPWITPATKHVKAHLDAYRTMPTTAFEALVASHLRTAIYYPVHEATLAVYLDQWKGELGQRLYLQNADQLRAEHTAEFEPLLPSITVPVRIVWGENDAWLPPATANRLHELIPTSDLLLLPHTGHFAMEDSPQQVAATLFDFFTDCSNTRSGSVASGRTR